LTTANVASLYQPLKLAVGSSVSITNGTNAAVFGFGTTAQGRNQFVIGQYNAPITTSATNDSAADALFIIGNGTGSTTSLQSNAFVVNRNGDARIGGKLLSGSGATASPNSVAAIGTNSAATGDYSVALGYGASAGGPHAIALGGFSSASGSYSVTLGLKSNALGENSFSMGFESAAIGGNSIALGQESTAWGDYAIALGAGASALDTGSVALGAGNTSDAISALSAGEGASALGYASVAIGRNVIAQGLNQVVIGQYNLPTGTPHNSYSEAGVWESNADLFIVGNGTGTDVTTRSNAFTVKKSGDVNVAGKLRVWPSGDLSMGTFKSGTKPSVGVDPDP
jgi:hypothetical protein